MKRVISLWLPTFATDRIDYRISGKSQVNLSYAIGSKPLATIISVAGSQQIANVSPSASALGIAPNQSLADARTIYPSLVTYEADPVSDLKALKTLRATCERYTPWVAIDPIGSVRADNLLWSFGLWLDVTGCAHLFGSEEEMLQDLFHLLKRTGYRAQIGLAATAGTAWALARYKTNYRINPWFILQEQEDMSKALAALPIAGLRLDRNTVEGLDRMGLRRIGDLYGVPRGPLVNRFGSVVLHRLGQALGTLDEPLSPEKQPPTFLSRLLFAEPIGQKKDVEAALCRLLSALCSDLTKASQGARQLLLTLYRVDSSLEYVRVGSSRAERNPSYLKRLFQECLDEIDLSFGVEAMVIAASETNSLEARQIELSSDLKTKQAENTRKLMDRLVIRLGFDSIVCLKPIARYFPELASQEIPAVLMPAGLKEEWKKLTHHPLRPLRLLARPLPVEVVVLTPGGLPVQFLWHRRRLKVAVAEGPERITAEWWKNDDNLKKNQPFVDRTRDYYRVEDEEGKRYWLYCEKTNQPDSLLKWYIHGFFA